MAANIATQLQDDALSNQFQLLFPQGIPGGGDSTGLVLRMDQQIDFPNDTNYTYDVDYQGFKTKKPGRKEETDKQFTLSFRLDANWVVYDSLLAWKEYHYNPLTGAGNDEASSRVPLIYQHLGAGDALKKLVTIQNCLIFDLKQPTGDHTSGDPMRVEAIFMYSHKT